MAVLNFMFMIIMYNFNMSSSFPDKNFQLLMSVELHNVPAEKRELQ